MEEGKRRFEAFARENSLGGVDPDGGPPIGGMFRKKAALPAGVNVLNPPERSELIYERLEGVPRGPSLDRRALSYRPSSGERTRDRGRRRNPPREAEPGDRERRDTRDKEPRDRRRRDEEPSEMHGRRSSRSDNELRKGLGDRTGELDSERKTVGEDEGISDPRRAKPLGSKKRERLTGSPSRIIPGVGERSRSNRSTRASGSRFEPEAKEVHPPPTREPQNPGLEVDRERAKGVNPFHPSKVGYSEKGKPFGKQAKPPSGESEYYESEEEETPVFDKVVPPETKHFRKPAIEPEYPVDPPPIPPLDVVPKGGGGHGGSKVKEDSMLAEFDARSMKIHTELGARDVEMEVDDILKTLKDDQWTEAFQSLVRPKKAATGMRYVRLMENFLEWVRKHEVANGGTLVNPVGKDLVWLYLHDLTKSSVGRMTPKSFLHALQFFSEALGYPTDAVRCRRTRKLVDVHSKPTKAKSQAPMFTVETMDYLEQVVTDPSLPKGYRVAAGKLRLCIQASLRWDDLAKTHFANVEWIRRRGENKVVGLRSKFGESKTGPRPWVASYLGVTREGDDWLCCLVNLLVESHGEAFKTHDHVGKSYGADGLSATTNMATFDQDVSFIRFLLVSAVEAGFELGVDLDDAKKARWHGAKPTLTSVMMHTGEGDRAVRFSGNWKEQRESMSDTYLRESQLLVLSAQEKALEYLREGGKIETLVGVPIGSSVQPGQSETAREGKVRRVEPSDWKSPGLELRDVVPSTLEECVSHGPLDEASLAGEMSGEDLTTPLEVLLGGEPKEDPADVEEEEAEGEEGMTDDDSSEDEFFITHFLRAGLTLRSGSLHKPKPHQDDAARCGTKAKSFEKIEAVEALERRSSFCKKCFGPATGCDKLCSAAKRLRIGDGFVVARCMRRCGLGCEQLAKYMDKDEREHRCDAHLELVPSPEGESPEGAS